MRRLAEKILEDIETLLLLALLILIVIPVMMLMYISYELEDYMIGRKNIYGL